MIQRSIAKTREKQCAGEGGFTLVELLIVIVILGILVAIVVLVIGGLAGTSKTAACNAEIKTIATAEDAYYRTSADAQGNGATFGTLAQIWRGQGNGANLLKDNPSMHWTDAPVSTTAYSFAGKANCVGLTAKGP